MPRSLYSSTLFVSLVLLVGCGEPAKTVTGGNRKDHIEEIGQMLKDLSAEGKKPPGKLSELDAVEPMLPLASQLIRSGEVVMVWGVGYAPGSQKVAAYEKKAETEGGWVLLQDGTVKEMTAGEFGAAKR